MQRRTSCPKSSDKKDIIEIESCTDSENIFKSKDWVHDENANKPLNTTIKTSENENKEPEHENPNYQEKINNVAREKVNRLPKEETGKNVV